MSVRIPAAVQHAALLLLSALLLWVSEVIPSIDTLSPVVTAFLGAVISWAIGFIAPIISSYGVGSRPATPDVQPGQV